MTTLETQLTELKAELQTYLTRQAQEKQDFGHTLEGTQTAIKALQKQVDALDVGLATRLHATDSGEDFTHGCESNDGLKRLLRDRKGNAIISCSVKSFNDFARKTTITDAAVGTGAFESRR